MAEIELKCGKWNRIQWWKQYVVHNIEFFFIVYTYNMF